MLLRLVWCGAQHLFVFQTLPVMLISNQLWTPGFHLDRLILMDEYRAPAGEGAEPGPTKDNIP